MGLEYLAYLRDVARQEQAAPGWALYNAQIRSRFDGYVWEDDGRIVGNVTLLPTRKQGKRIFLDRQRGCESRISQPGNWEKINRTRAWLVCGSVRAARPGCRCGRIIRWRTGCIYRWVSLTAPAERHGWSINRSPRDQTDPKWVQSTFPQRIRIGVFSGRGLNGFIRMM